MHNIKKNVYEEIVYIYRTIEQTKKKYIGLFVLFISYAIIQSVSLLLNFGTEVIFRPGITISIINSIIKLSFSVVMIFIYIWVYNREKKTNNRYYIGCINIWGITTVSSPIIFFLVRCILYNNKNIIKILPKLEDYYLLINIVLFCLAIIITGVVTNKIWILVCSIFYLLSSITLLSISGLNYNIANSKIVVNVNYIINYMTYIIGYVCLAILLWRQGKKSGNI